MGTNQATFSTQPMFEVFNPQRTGHKHATMQPVAPQATPKQLNAQFTGGAESQHDRASKVLIDSLIGGVLGAGAWSAWERHRKPKGKHAKPR